MKKNLCTTILAEISRTLFGKKLTFEDYSMFSKKQKKDFKLYRKLLKNDTWYEENKGKYVFIVDQKVVGIDKDELILLDKSKDEDYGGVLQFIDRNPEPVYVPSYMFE